MAGVRLNRIYEKRSLLFHVGGVAYSSVVSIAPMVIIMLDIVLMEYFLGFDTVSYSVRELFSGTVLYMFIFALCTTSPLNAVLSRYMSDLLYDELYQDVMPAYYTGLSINVIVSAIPAIPFCIMEVVKGGVDPFFSLMGYVGYFALVWMLYTMIYLSIVKDYGKVALFYLLGMGLAFGAAWLFVKIFDMEITYGMLMGLDIGLLFIGSLMYAQLTKYFTESSHNYRRVLPYFKSYAGLIVSNTCYIVGLYIHNMIVWTTDLRVVTAGVFVSAEPYDMASFIALITNISATVIFISRVEMNFHSRYKGYSEAVIGGRYLDVKTAQDHMFLSLASELLSLARIQFIVSVVSFLIFMVTLPLLGISGLVMQIYPLLASAYFILFIMYSAIIFLYYFNDTFGAILTSGTFMGITIIGTLVAIRYDYIWYGAGVFAGSLAGWFIAYFRLRWAERHMETHIFCRGLLLHKGKGQRPPDEVYNRDKKKKEEKDDVEGEAAYG